MKVPYRYLSALFINVALPWLAYRLAQPHWGPVGALAASAVPLLAWIVWDLYHSRHFDALSAIVLAGILLSLAWALIDKSQHRRAIEDPMVTGAIGLTFLLSLPLRKPMIYYLARSTAARESPDSVTAFEHKYRTRPDFVARLRMMTVIWGIGLTAESVLRYWVVSAWPDAQQAVQISTALRWSIYGGLTLWTIWTRRHFKRIEKNMESA